MAPDITVTDDPDVLAAGAVHWGVMGSAAFLEWATPQVQCAEKVRVLRDRWEGEASRGRLDNIPTRSAAHRPTQAPYRFDR